jgi:hypothetical protein
MNNQPVQQKVTVCYHLQLTLEDHNEIQSSRLGTQLAARYLFLPLTVQYYDAYHEGKFRNCTFYVYVNDVPVIAFLGFTSEGQLGFFHLPAEVISIDTDAAVLDRAYSRLLQELNRILLDEKITGFRYASDPYLCGAFFGEAHHQTFHTCMVNLELSEEQIFGNIRKSFKSLVNWGKRELSVQIMSQGNADAQLYEKIKQFHIQVAGRKTRNDLTWEKHFESVRTGEGYIVIGSFEGMLASVAIRLHGSEEAFYGVGINDRTLMEKHPVGHYPLLRAILHAKSIGLKRFNLNEIDPVENDEKANNISGFKKGFSKTLIPRTIYSVKFARS